MTKTEQAIEAARKMLSDTWYDGRNDRYTDTMPNLAKALVAQIAPLLTSDLQARLDAAEARQRERCAKVRVPAPSHAPGRLDYYTFKRGWDAGIYAKNAAIRTGAKP